MKKIVTTPLLGAYALVRATGILRSGPGRFLFEKLYLFYKARFEARAARRLEAHVRPGQTVIDVGANIGFFTALFANWVSDGGQVIALEPEEVNFQRLRRMIATRRLDHVVDAVQAVAADQTGERRLAVNPDHPGDHKLAADGVVVQAHTLDDLVASRGNPTICLIKIDVQGAEQMVLAGARDLIARDRPALYVEIDGASLSAHGTTAAALIDTLYDLGYRGHKPAGRETTAFSREELLAEFADTDLYADVLFIAD